MVLSLSISVDAEAKLKAKAAAAGVDVETYAARQLERMATPPKSLREISGPIAEACARNGLNEDQLADFLEAEKHAMRVAHRVRTVELNLDPAFEDTYIDHLCLP